MPSATLLLHWGESLRLRSCMQVREQRFAA